MKKWNANDIVKFLHIYESFPILWNLKGGEDRIADKKLREKRFEMLVVDLNSEGLLRDMTNQQLRAKIKGIKDVYRQELAKIERSKKAVAEGSSSDIYTPKLAWFDNADFLRDVISTRESKPDIELRFVPEEAEYNVDIKDEFVNSRPEAVEETTIELTRHKRKATDPLSNNIITEAKCMPKNHPNNAVTSSKDVDLPYFNEVYSKLKRPTEDLFDQFGKYVAAELRGLPAREAILLQQEVQSSITRVKLSCVQP